MANQTMRVLSIDAWANPCDPDCEACECENGPDCEGEATAHNGGFSWNNWFDVGRAPRTLCGASEADQIAWFIDNGFVNEKAKAECYIDDDQYNLVIAVKATHKPLYALEYGNEEDVDNEETAESEG